MEYTTMVLPSSLLEEEEELSTEELLSVQRKTNLLPANLRTLC